MTSRRLLKAAEAIREVVSMAILTEIRDPRVRNVTVTSVEVAPDMRSAKVFVSVMGDLGRQQLCLRGLNNAAGFLQAKIASRIDTRYTPRLTFSLDDGVKKSLEVARILKQIADERSAREQQEGSVPENACESPAESPHTSAPFTEEVDEE
ncbi:MAG: ribosome-binding factor A [Pirellulaceae bacterium]|nr:MAG: ribosome-binding factor A [Pirellulaceae bacterium]